MIAVANQKVSLHYGEGAVTSVKYSTDHIKELISQSRSVNLAMVHRSMNLYHVTKVNEPLSCYTGQ